MTAVDLPDDSTSVFLRHFPADQSPSIDRIHTLFELNPLTAQLHYKISGEPLGPSVEVDGVTYPVTTIRRVILMGMTDSL